MKQKYTGVNNEKSLKLFKKTNSYIIKKSNKINNEEF